MKTKLIMLDTPIIVSDEEIKKGDYFLVDEKYIILCKGKGSETFINGNFYRSKSQKIIAGIEGLPLIDWNGLEEFGWVDIEKLNKEAYIKHSVNDDRLTLDEQIQRTGGFNVGFKEGFKKAQSLNEKKFSLEDLTNMFILGGKHKMQNPNTFLDKMGEIIQSLQQPKVFDIEVEIEDYKSNGYSAPYKVKPKITNNSIKILKKL